MNDVRQNTSGAASAAPTTADTVRGRVLVLLILTALLHVIYPVTLSGDSASLIAYNVLYAGMFLAGIVIASDSRRHLIVTVVIALAWLVMAVLYALDPANTGKVLATYLALGAFQAALVWLLLRYIFRARAVTGDVLYAAITVYILIGALFVPVYGTLELLAPGAFVDNATAHHVFWQQFIYFSLVTLTTSGYGDILPVSGWARAVANIEQVVGVLYIAILMARLVGLYSQPQVSGGTS